MLEDIRRDHSKGLHGSVCLKAPYLRSAGDMTAISECQTYQCLNDATVKLQQGGFYLEDKESKFGTLLQVKRNLNMVPGVAVSLQVNRTVVALKRRSSSRGGCSSAAGASRLMHTLLESLQVRSRE